MCKIITFWERIGSRVFEGGGNDGFGGFLRFTGILEKSSKTGFKDRTGETGLPKLLRTGPL